MKNIVHRALLVLIVLMMLLGCDRNPIGPSSSNIDTTLPPVTTSGKNTFGCKYNGSYWMPVPYKTQSVDFGNGQLIIQYKKYGNNLRSTITISSFDNIVLSEGKYYFNDQFQASCLDTDNTINYTLFNDYCFIDIIKLDSINNIISGLFQFQYVNKKNDTIKISDGRFDFNYKL